MLYPIEIVPIPSPDGSPWELRVESIFTRYSSR